MIMRYINVLLIIIIIYLLCYQEINSFRGTCGSLFLYDWVTVPIGYTQVNCVSFNFI